MAVYEKWATLKYGTLTVGKDDHGHNVKLYGATSGSYLLWDASTDDLLLVGAAGLTVAGAVALSSTTGIRSTATFVPDATRTNYAFAMGLSSGHTVATALAVTMVADGAQNLDPFQMNINIIGANPSATSTTNLMYALLTHSTTHMAALRLKCTDFTVAVAKNVLDAYAYQGEIDITGTTAIGNEACVLGLTMSCASGTITGLVRGIVVLMSGASMPANAAAVYVNVGGNATLTHGFMVATQGGTTVTNAIYIEQGGTVTNILKFDATSGAVVSKSNSGGAQSYTVRCAVGGVTGYIRLYAD